MQRAVLIKNGIKGAEATSPVTDGSAETQPSTTANDDLKKIEAGMKAIVAAFRASRQSENHRAAAKAVLGFTA
jgi:hypothetical protein